MVTTAVFERLAEHFERLLFELRQLVEKEDAVVRERDLARRGDRAAADQAGVRNGVVRRAERPAWPECSGRVS